MLTELAKEIADSGKWVPRSGMAATISGEGRIRLSSDGMWVRNWSYREDFWTDAMIEDRSVLWPDLTDPATVGGLLLADMPDSSLERVETYGGDWRWVCDEGLGDRHKTLTTYATRAEAIARAWLAVCGGAA